MAKIDQVHCFKNTVIVAENTSDGGLVSKLVLKPNARVVEKVELTRVSDSIVAMSYNPFKLQFGKNKKVTQEGIIVIDAKGQVHSLCWDPSNQATELVHTVVQLHKNIEFFKEANWNTFHMSPQALMFKSKIYNVATGNEENKLECEADREGLAACTINGSTALLQVAITKSGFRFL